MAGFVVQAPFPEAETATENEANICIYIYMYILYSYVILNRNDWWDTSVIGTF